MITPVICEGLGKVYQEKKKEIIAVQGINLEVDQGELFGLIGPDGAGKTTLFRMLTTLMIPTTGKALINDLNTVGDFRKIRQFIGYMPGRFSLYQDLTVKENLHFFATLFHTTIEANYEQIKDIYIQLEPFQNRRAGKLSGGMKQKLALCCTLVHQPSILFLDEPTTGVDPVSRKEFWQMLKKLKKDGMTIIVSTPYMDEASLCDRIALIQDGKILKIDSPSTVSNQFGRSLYAIESDHSFHLLHALRDIPMIDTCFSFGNAIHVTIKTGDQNSIEKVSIALEQQGISDVKISEITPGIEDVFMDLLQKQVA
jgi:ABC-type multidrug transport system ATPase subunit